MRMRGWMMMGSLFLCGGIAWGSAPQPRTLTLLVVPERYNLVQTAFDVISKRPVALVAYRGEAGTEEPILHAWTGQQWLPVTFDDYADGSFLLAEPARIVLVGSPELLPESLVRSSQWGPMVLSINTVETDAFLNDLGQLLDFTPAEWRWFAGRYNMEMDDVSKEQDRISWYDQMSRARKNAPRFEVPEAGTVPVIEEMPVKQPERTSVVLPLDPPATESVDPLTK